MNPAAITPAQATVIIAAAAYLAWIARLWIDAFGWLREVGR